MDMNPVGRIRANRESMAKVPPPEKEEVNVSSDTATIMTREKSIRPTPAPTPPLLAKESKEIKTKPVEQPLTENPAANAISDTTTTKPIPKTLPPTPSPTKSPTPSPAAVEDEKIQAITAQRIAQHASATTEDGDKILSIVILTYNKPELLASLLQSILPQKTTFEHELIVADNGCLDETTKVLHDNLNGDVKYPYKYIPICSNPGYSVGNNLAVQKMASNSTKWVLFLNDDVQLQDGFIQSLVDLGEAMPNAGAVGCKLLDGDGVVLREAGGMISKSGSCSGYGRLETDFDADIYSYARPVDYISGACLMMDKKDFLEYGGFDGDTYPAYYEDADIQTHITYDLGKEVWYQPLAVAWHKEHVSFASESSNEKWTMGQKAFRLRWGRKLRDKKIIGPHPFSPATVRASDVRCYRGQHLSILYIAEQISNETLRTSNDRSFDNMKMIAELGHRISFHAVTEEPLAVRHDLQQTGIEVMYSTDVRHNIWKRLAMDFYDVVVVSGPTIIAEMMKTIGGQTKAKGNFVTIFDAETLTYRQDEKREQLIKEGLPFPSNSKGDGASGKESLASALKSEIDVIVTVSELEKDLVKELDESLAHPVHTIGITMEAKDSTASQFEERHGMLFVAEFEDNMFYSGDAIWYFLDRIYPLIMKEAMQPIRLVIAGRRIPHEIKDMVNSNSELVDLVEIVESPDDVRTLHEKARIVIAPHLYGAGVEKKASDHYPTQSRVPMYSFSSITTLTLVISECSSSACGSSLGHVR